MTDRAVVFPAPGQAERRLLAFESPLLAGYEWPYFSVNGADDGPTLCIIAGIHGAEYPPIDAVMRFCRSLDAGALRGRVVGVPVVNLPAFWERTPFVCPRDGKNPNRVFPGRADGSFSEVLAYHLFEAVIRQGDYLIDLHCGDMVEDLAPFSIVQESGDRRVDDTALAMATAFALTYTIFEPRGGGPISGTTNAAAADAGIPAIIAEAGGVGQLQPEAVQLHLRGLRRTLQRLGMLEGTPEQLPDPVMIKDFVWVRAERGGFFHRSVVAGDSIAEGGLIGRMVDLWGEPREEITSPVSGIALFTTTSPAIADGGLLIGIGVPA